MSLFLLIILALPLLNLLWWWQTDSLLRRHARGWRIRIWPAMLATGMALLYAGLIVSLWTNFPFRAYLPQPVLAALYIWHLVVMPIWLLFSPAISLFSLLRARTKRTRKTDKACASENGWDRRGFLAYSIAAAPAVLLAGTTTVSMPQLRTFRIRRFELEIPHLPPALEGLTLAHVSDVHVGHFTSGEILRRISGETNKLDADLVLLTGDLINDNLEDLPEAIGFVRELEARHGVFLCEGNHDLIPGPHEFGMRIKAAGLNLLVNEQQTLLIRGEPLQILGLRWGKGKGLRTRAEDYSEEAISGSLNDLLQMRNEAAFPILLAHHPHAFDFAARAGLPLVLSGHTHGGQLMINEDLGFGPALFRYWTGVYRKNQSVLAVSNGVGNWFPLRTAAPAEILHLTLHRPKNGERH